jgi:adenosine deaminase
MDDFGHWADLLNNPDPLRADEMAKVYGSWIMYPEDLALAIYDIGVALSKQNVRYAEVALAPSEYVGSARMNFDTFLAALNDGRDRSLRAWNVDMAWIFCVPRDNPRAGDDVARWVSGSASRRGNVVGLGLTGPEEVQPVGQFRRAFATAQKKELYTIVDAGENLGASGVGEAIDVLQPNRLVNAWRGAEDESVLTQLVGTGIPVVMSLARVLNTGQVRNAGDVPLPRLLEHNVDLALSCDLPSLYQSTLIDEYILAQEEYGIPIETLIQLARRSIELTRLDADRKENLLRSYDSELKTARSRLLDRS